MLTLFTRLVGTVALHFFASTTVAAILVVVWIGLFLWIYRKRYGHL